MKYTRFADIPRFISHGNYAVDYPLDYFMKWVEEEEREEGLQLYPDFQRGHVWTEKQQIAFIEFLLRGGKSGRDVYFNYPSWHHSVPPNAYNEYVCVDGLQRITAIKRFIKNEIKVFGSYRQEFTDSPRILQDTIRVHINDLKTKREVLQWYLEMNSGGTPHTDEEIERIKEMMNDLN